MREPTVLQHRLTEAMRSVPRGGVVLPPIGRANDHYAREWDATERKQNPARRRT
jgi:hypothetical protein